MSQVLQQQTLKPVSQMQNGLTFEFHKYFVERRTTVKQ